MYCFILVVRLYGRADTQTGMVKVPFQLGPWAPLVLERRLHPIIRYAIDVIVASYLVGTYGRKNDVLHSTVTPT